jgi:hypothetical protein
MARGTEEQKQTADEIGADFPYRALMRHPAWPVIDRALRQLEKNGDVELQTASRYVIGHVIEQLVASGLIPPAIAFTADTESAVHPMYRWILELKEPLPIPASTSSSSKPVGAG